MIKKLVATIALSIFFFNASACENGTHEELVQFWDKFLPLAISGRPAELSKFFSFPIKLYGVHKEMKPIVITRKTFLTHYEVIFRKNSSGEEQSLFRNLKSYSANAAFRNITLQDFDSAGCFIRHSTIIGDYIVYRSNKAWKIKGIDAANDYDIIASEIEFF